MCVKVDARGRECKSWSHFNIYLQSQDVKKKKKTTLCSPCIDASNWYQIYSTSPPPQWVDCGHPSACEGEGRRESAEGGGEGQGDSDQVSKGMKANVGAQEGHPNLAFLGKDGIQVTVVGGHLERCARRRTDLFATLAVMHKFEW